MNPGTLTHPYLATFLIVAALLGCALVLPTRYFPRRSLLMTALVLGAGFAGAAGVAVWLGHGGVSRTASLAQVSLASTLLIVYSMTPPTGGKWCGSGSSLIVGALIMAIAMVLSEAL